MSLDVEGVCFDEEHDIINTVEKSRKFEALPNGVDLGNKEQWPKMSSA